MPLFRAETPPRHRWIRVGCPVRYERGAGQSLPLHDIVITNFVWCKAYKREVGRGIVYCPITVQ